MIFHVTFEITDNSVEIIDHKLMAETEEIQEIEKIDEEGIVNRYTAGNVIITLLKV
jgi:hypothetical protein